MEMGRATVTGAGELWMELTLTSGATMENAGGLPFGLEVVSAWLAPYEELVVREMMLAWFTIPTSRGNALLNIPSV